MAAMVRWLFPALCLLTARFIVDDFTAFDPSQPIEGHESFASDGGSIWYDE